MRVIFIGAVEFSKHMLATLIDVNASIVGVVTATQGNIYADYADLSSLCNENNIPLYKTDDVNAIETLHWAQDLQPDVIFCMGWSRLIKKELLQMPSLGVVGYHPAALPQNRGRHPLIWALVLGLEKTGSTFFLMDEGADSGDIISQREIIITEDDDASSLYCKMIETAKQQVVVLLSELESGSTRLIKQDNSKANMWRKRGIKDGEIDWRMHSVGIRNLVRGLARPYVGAHFLIDGDEYKVWSVGVKNCPEMGNIEPGRVVGISDDEHYIVKCWDACIELVEIEPLPELNVGQYL